MIIKKRKKTHPPTHEELKKEVVLCHMFVFQYHGYIIFYMDRKLQEGAASAFTAHKLLHRRAESGHCKILAVQAHRIVCCPTVYKEQRSCYQLQVNTSGKCANATT